MAFGRFEDTWHPRFPLDRLVENRVRIPVPSQRRPYEPFFINGKSVLVVRDGQGRSRWKCGRCGGLCRYVYFDELVCQRCAGLDWSSRHINRTLPALQRAIRLRRLIGADPRPFTPIARQPRARHRIHAHMREILALEALLVEQLGRINDDLMRRVERS